MGKREKEIFLESKNIEEFANNIKIWFYENSETPLKDLGYKMQLMFNCIKTSVDGDTVYATMEVSAWINTPVSYTQISETTTRVNYLQPRNYLELNKFYIKLIFEKDEESNYHLARINPRDLMYSVFEDFKLGDFFNKDWSCNNLGELLGFRWIKSYNL